MKKLLILSMVLLFAAVSFADTLNERITAVNQNRESEISSVMSLYEYEQFSAAVDSAGFSKDSFEASLRAMPDDQLTTLAQTSREARNMMSLTDRDTVNVLLIVLIIIAIVAVVAIAAD